MEKAPAKRVKGVVYQPGRNRDERSVRYVSPENTGMAGAGGEKFSVAALSGGSGSIFPKCMD